MVVDVLVQVAELGEPAGTVKIVKSWGSTSSTSSQRTGVETRASGKPRTEYAAAMVWSRAFWL